VNNLLKCLSYFSFIQILSANTIHVPSTYSTIQAGVDTAFDGDTVLIASGIYYEQLVLSEKSIVLASYYIFTHDQTDISQTIIDGGNNNYTISIESSAGMETVIEGLTIRNGDDGIIPHTKFNILNCVVSNCNDGIDYESGSGGVCENNIFENNNDDGIDLDDAVEITIENNIIRNNNDDGIEIRLHPYSGITLNVEIINNYIDNNGEDGIQIIDYPGLTDRILRIENNLITNNSMVGVGCMADGQTVEDYQGASIPEPIYLINNTISGNNYGITGGANLLAYNNIISASISTATKNVNGNSLISYSNFWNNGQNFDNCIKDDQSLVFSDPQFISSSDYHIQITSPCIRAGTPNGGPQIDIEYSQRGNPPDIGAYENISDGDQSLSVELTLWQAISNNGVILLTWITESEIENLGFIVERRRAGNDHWQLIDTYLYNTDLEGQGSTTERTQYELIDSNLGLEGTYEYRLSDVNYGNKRTYHDIIILTLEVRVMAHDLSSIALLDAFPNPFNSSTCLRFEIPNDGSVSLNIYDLKGIEIAKLIQENKMAGRYTVLWNSVDNQGDPIPAGVYIAKVKAGNHFQIVKLLYLE
jgi:hypothetical protein